MKMVMLSDNEKITSDGLANLKSIRILIITRCHRITDVNKISIGTLKRLEINWCNTFDKNVFNIFKLNHEKTVEIHVYPF